MVTWQLRRYTINKGRLDDFVDAWRRGVYPLRLKFGFTIDGAWVIQERSEFVWIMSLPGTLDDWRVRDAAYYASADRTALHPDPAQWIARAERWFITPALPRPDPG